MFFLPRSTNDKSGKPLTNSRIQRGNAICPICQSATTKVGDKTGRVIKRDFSLFHCRVCGFYYVENPETDYSLIYDHNYYRGRGADQSIDYIYEYEHYQTTVRNYEWQGIATIASHFLKNLEGKKWLDYGCGTGGLLRYCEQKYNAEMFGFDQGWAVERAKAAGMRILPEDSLESHHQSFDVITAIEVLEHCLDPIIELQRIRSLLKPGGLFFYTTGNSQPFEEKILSWPYFAPEIHISLFQPKTMAYALKACRFQIEDGFFLPGLEELIHYKVLKALGFKDMSYTEKWLPWAALARLVDKKYQISAYPIARG